MLGRRDLRRRHALPEGGPWERLRPRERIPNILLQMLLRGSNGVGYTNYPDNVVTGFFVGRRPRPASTCFRVFDCLNWVENMRVAMDAVLDERQGAKRAICYTGDMNDPDAVEIRPQVLRRAGAGAGAAGAHILGIKDMAGLVKPAAAGVLVRALKEETGLPVHFHTHDTSGISAASVLAAVDAGVDAVDAAMDSLLGQHLPAQSRLAVAALKRHGPRDTGLDPGRSAGSPFYWEAVRRSTPPSRATCASGASEVYLHEMPGGQFTNLKEQARSLGLEERWHEVARPMPTSTDVRRHRQGDAVVQGGRRHGAGHGEPGPDPRRRRGSRQGHLLPGIGGLVLPRRHRPAAGRLPGGAAEARC
jgi:pyruvate carboxylase